MWTFITTAQLTNWISTNRLLPVYPLISTADTDTDGILGIIPITDTITRIITAVGTVHGITDGTIRGITAAAGMIRGIITAGTGIIPDTTAHIGVGMEARTITEDIIIMEGITLMEEVITITETITATVVKAIL